MMLDTSNEHSSASSGTGASAADAAAGPSGQNPSWLRERLVPLVVAATFFMQLLDTSIMNTSLPQMARSFGVPPLDMSLGVTVYMLVFAALLPLSGWLSERFGARRVFLCAVVVFLLSSLGCGFSPGLPSFVAARALQGMGASMMTPVGRVIVLQSTSKSRYLQAIATITWPSLTAPLIGPLLGGFVTTWLSWRWNFFLNLPIGLASLVLIRRIVPRFAPQPSRAFDLKGFVLTSSALAALLHGFESIAHGDGIRPTTWTAVAWGVVGGMLAFRHLRRVRQPLLDLSSLSFATFRLSNLAGGMWIRVAISTTPFLLPLMFQVGMGCSPIVAGAYLSTYFAGNFAMKTVTTATLRRFGFRPVVIVNGLGVGLSLVAMVLVDRTVPVVVLGTLLFAAGLVRSMQFTSLSSLAFADIPKQLNASASTFSSMANQAAMALGVTLAAGLLNASRVFADRSHLVLRDFHVAFAGAACFAFAASWQFRALPPDAGHEISGRPARTHSAA